MTTIEIRASRNYQVQVGDGLLCRAGERLRAVTEAGTAVIVSGEHVLPLYGDRLERSLRQAGFRVLRFCHRSGEVHKNLETYGELLRFLSENDVTRGDVLVALGGGVTGDLTGFAAATYQRGMDYVQIPTTLLAMVDSSVGGKTAVDLPAGKNQVGCFYQPALVLCDPELLATLPEEEYRGGCAEVIKYALLGDPVFFTELGRKPVREQYEQVICRCVRAKRDLVAQDEFDRGSRRLLNLGHSFGHAVEACSSYTVLHGQAVAVGMAMITRAAVARGLCRSETLDALLALLQDYGLPTETDFSAQELEKAVRNDKKRSEDGISLVVPTEIGSCRILPVAMEELPDWLRQGGAR